MQNQMVHNDILLFRVETKFTVKLSGHPDYLSWSPDGKYIAVMNDVQLMTWNNN